MSAVATVLSVSRSDLIEHTGKRSKPRGPYLKLDDLALLAELRLIHQRAADLRLSAREGTFEPAAAQERKGWRFIIDARGRTIIFGVAVIGACITGKTFCDLMMAASNASSRPSWSRAQLEWVPDNGSA